MLPQSPILRKNRNQSANDISKILKEWNIDRLVVGLPTSGSSADEMSCRIRHFISLLDFKDIVYQDEDYSSINAQEMAKGVFRNTRDGKIDSLSAKIILESYLDSIH